MQFRHKVRIFICCIALNFMVPVPAYTAILDIKNETVELIRIRLWTITSKGDQQLGVYNVNPYGRILQGRSIQNENAFLDKTQVYYIRNGKQYSMSYSVRATPPGFGPGRAPVRLEIKIKETDTGKLAIIQYMDFRSFNTDKTDPN